MTRPEISLFVLNGILSRQDGHIPMRPSDMALMARELDALRDSLEALRIAATTVPPRPPLTLPIPRNVVPFPGRVRA